jgi:DNA-binding transcriptional regulator YiaG
MGRLRRDAHRVRGFVVNTAELLERDVTTAGSAAQTEALSWLATGTLVASLLGGTGTTVPVMSSERILVEQSVTSTTVNIVLPKPTFTGSRDLAASVRSLHARSGLSWEQLAKLFAVSRRAVHKWAAGGAMNMGNAARLAELHTAIDPLGDDPAIVRARLIASDDRGKTLLQTLIRPVNAPGLDLDQRIGSERHGDMTSFGKPVGSKRLVVQPKKTGRS